MGASGRSSIYRGGELGTQRGVRGGKEAIHLCGVVTPNGPHGAFRGWTQLGRVEKLDLSFSTGQG
jgi:hypothetical protein